MLISVTEFQSTVKNKVTETKKYYFDAFANGILKFEL